VVTARGVMAERLILILGGARSGKSTLARDLAQKLGDKVLFVATAEALDTEMALRIEEHKRTRPHNWRAVELNSKVGERLRSQIKDADVVLLDCITLLISNVLIKALNKKHSVVLTGNGDESTGAIIEAEKEVMAEVQSLVDCIDRFRGSFIVVSNEVGLGLVPERKLGRIFRDLQGKVNQVLARHATEVYFMVSGIPVKIKG